MTADDFRAELAALANGLRRTIEADCASFPADAKASAQRVRRVQGDFPFFRRTYFPHYTRRKDGTPTGDSALHLWLDTALPAAVDNPEGIRQACAAPRGEAKTTFVDVFFSLWCVVTGRKRYIFAGSRCLRAGGQLPGGHQGGAGKQPAPHGRFPRPVRRGARLERGHHHHGQQRQDTGVRRGQAYAWPAARSAPPGPGAA